MFDIEPNDTAQMITGGEIIPVNQLFQAYLLIKSDSKVKLDGCKDMLELLRSINGSKIADSLNLQMKTKFTLEEFIQGFAKMQVIDQQVFSKMYARYRDILANIISVRQFIESVQSKVGSTIFTKITEQLDDIDIQLREFINKALFEKLYNFKFVNKFDAPIEAESFLKTLVVNNKAHYKQSTQAILSELRKNQPILRLNKALLTILSEFTNLGSQTEKIFSLLKTMIRDIEISSDIRERQEAIEKLEKIFNAPTSLHTGGIGSNKYIMKSDMYDQSTNFISQVKRQVNAEEILMMVVQVSINLFQVMKVNNNIQQLNKMRYAVQNAVRFLKSVALGLKEYVEGMSIKDTKLIDEYYRCREQFIAIADSNSSIAEFQTIVKQIDLAEQAFLNIQQEYLDSEINMISFDNDIKQVLEIPIDSIISAITTLQNAVLRMAYKVNLKQVQDLQSAHLIDIDKYLSEVSNTMLKKQYDKQVEEAKKDVLAVAGKDNSGLVNFVRADKKLINFAYLPQLHMIMQDKSLFDTTDKRKQLIAMLLVSARQINTQLAAAAAAGAPAVDLANIPVACATSAEFVLMYDGLKVHGFKVEQSVFDEIQKEPNATFVAATNLANDIDPELYKGEKHDSVSKQIWQLLSIDMTALAPSTIRDVKAPYIGQLNVETGFKRYMLKSMPDKHFMSQQAVDGYTFVTHFDLSGNIYVPKLDSKDIIPLMSDFLLPQDKVKKLVDQYTAYIKYINYLHEIIETFTAYSTENIISGRTSQIDFSSVLNQVHTQLITDANPNAANFSGTLVEPLMTGGAVEDVVSALKRDDFSIFEKDGERHTEYENFGKLVDLFLSIGYNQYKNAKIKLLDKKIVRMLFMELYKWAAQPMIIHKGKSTADKIAETTAAWDNHTAAQTKGTFQILLGHAGARASGLPADPAPILRKHNNIDKEINRIAFIPVNIFKACDKKHTPMLTPSYEFGKIVRAMAQQCKNLVSMNRIFLRELNDMQDMRVLIGAELAPIKPQTKTTAKSNFLLVDTVIRTLLVIHYYMDLDFIEKISIEDDGRVAQLVRIVIQQGKSYEFQSMSTIYYIVNELLSKQVNIFGDIITLMNRGIQYVLKDQPTQKHTMFQFDKDGSATAHSYDTLDTYIAPDTEINQTSEGIELSLARLVKTLKAVTSDSGFKQRSLIGRYLMKHYKNIVNNSSDANIEFIILSIKRLESDNFTGDHSAHEREGLLAALRLQFEAFLSTVDEICDNFKQDTSLGCDLIMQLLIKIGYENLSFTEDKISIKPPRIENDIIIGGADPVATQSIEQIITKICKKIEDFLNDTKIDVGVDKISAYQILIYNNKFSSDSGKPGANQAQGAPGAPGAGAPPPPPPPPPADVEVDFKVIHQYMLSIGCMWSKVPHGGAEDIKIYHWFRSSIDAADSAPKQAQLKAIFDTQLFQLTFLPKPLWFPDPPPTQLPEVTSVSDEGIAEIKFQTTKILPILKTEPNAQILSNLRNVVGNTRYMKLNEGTANETALYTVSAFQFVNYIQPYAFIEKMKQQTGIFMIEECICPPQFVIDYFTQVLGTPYSILSSKALNTFSTDGDARDKVQLKEANIIKVHLQYIVGMKQGANGQKYGDVNALQTIQQLGFKNNVYQNQNNFKSYGCVILETNLKVNEDDNHSKELTIWADGKDWIKQQIHEQYIGADIVTERACFGDEQSNAWTLFPYIQPNNTLCILMLYKNVSNRFDERAAALFVPVTILPASAKQGAEPLIRITGFDIGGIKDSINNAGHLTLKQENIADREAQARRGGRLDGRQTIQYLQNKSNDPLVIAFNKYLVNFLSKMEIVSVSSDNPPLVFILENFIGKIFNLVVDQSQNNVEGSPRIIYTETVDLLSKIVQKYQQTDIEKKKKQAFIDSPVSMFTQQYTSIVSNIMYFIYEIHSIQTSIEGKLKTINKFIKLIQKAGFQDQRLPTSRDIRELMMLNEYCITIIDELSIKGIQYTSYLPNLFSSSLVADEPSLLSNIYFLTTGEGETEQGRIMFCRYLYQKLFNSEGLIQYIQQACSQQVSSLHIRQVESYAFFIFEAKQLLSIMGYKHQHTNILSDSRVTGVFVDPVLQSDSDARIIQMIMPLHQCDTGKVRNIQMLMKSIDSNSEIGTVFEQNFKDIEQQPLILATLRKEVPLLYTKVNDILFLQGTSGNTNIPVDKMGEEIVAYQKRLHSYVAKAILQSALAVETLSDTQNIGLRDVISKLLK